MRFFKNDDVPIWLKIQTSVVVSQLSKCLHTKTYRIKTDVLDIRSILPISYTRAILQIVNVE